ncbi:hypothetical protein GCK32_022791, partial [Trichostrongylus colubriformis]
MLDVQAAAEVEDRDHDPELHQTTAQVKEALEISENMSSKLREEWNLDYLTALRYTQKIKRRRKGVIPQVRDIVLMEQELIPRG